LRAGSGPYPAKRNPAYQLDRPITKQSAATEYNNFLEFGDRKDIWKFVDRFRPEPWTIRITGLVHKPQTVDVAALLRSNALEERLYRLRCVEGWSIAVPWTGVPLKTLIEQWQPTSDARYLRFVSFFRPDEAPYQKAKPEHPWPHNQGLTLAEAMNELTLLATGLYGHEMPRQNGAPVRLVAPWKYGFKSLKSIVAIEFTAEKPHTFWNDLYPQHDHFVANVDPRERYQDRSQSSERLLGTWEVRPTLPFNGYAPWVAHLYPR
jgi:sulfoxide reductase catalytic subunit YedY